METLDRVDRERRRAKQRTWWKVFFRPLTLKMLMKLAPLLTALVGFADHLIRLFRE